jgi:hypothetical protein
MKMKNNLNIMALCGALVVIAPLCGCGCYPYGFDDMIGDDFDGCRKEKEQETKVKRGNQLPILFRKI